MRREWPAGRRARPEHVGCRHRCRQHDLRRHDDAAAGAGDRGLRQRGHDGARVCRRDQHPRCRPDGGRPVGCRLRAVARVPPEGDRRGGARRGAAVVRQRSDGQRRRRRPERGMVRRLSPDLARLGGDGLHAGMPGVVPHPVDDGDRADDRGGGERRTRRRPARARDDLRRQPGVDADENAPDATCVRGVPPGVAIPGSLQDRGRRRLRRCCSRPKSDCTFPVSTPRSAFCP